MKRITIFTGHFGSGKTEVSINFAISLKKIYNKVILIDLDIVNPYFRTKDAEEMLRKEGIRVIASKFANTNVDIPALPPEILSAFSDKDAAVVIDVGGDEDGAVALGRYKKQISAEPYDMFFVFNQKRPGTETREETLMLLHAIEQSSRLSVTGLVNNTNVMGETTHEDILEGQELLERISAETGKPLRFISGTKEVLQKLPGGLKGEPFPLKLQLKMPWNEEV